MSEQVEITEIRRIAGGYGCLNLRYNGKAYHLTMKSWQDIRDDDWQEIPKSLYDELIAFNKKGNSK